MRSHSVHYVLLTLFACVCGDYMDTFSRQRNFRGFQRQNFRAQQPSLNDFFTPRNLLPRQSSQPSFTGALAPSIGGRQRTREKFGRSAIRSRGQQLAIGGRAVRPSYLDPANFRLPSLTLKHMESTLAEIERHMRAKGSNPADYTSSRLLITLLREQCARMRPFGDTRLQMFCNQFNARFRSLFF